MIDVVISGISGRFPGCDNTEELQEALMKGDDLVSDNHGRWLKDFHGLTNRAGIMKDIENFDNEFFAIPPRQAHGLDPRTRLLMETTFEALMDAGVNPMEIRGSKTAIFIGMTASKGNDSVFENKINYNRIGRSLAMTTGMISFVFDLRGPSFALDTACSSSMYAFCQAVRSIKSGECDAAIVCGATILLDPFDSLQYKTMNILSPTGKCKFLDESRDGYVKSESVVVTYLQKSEDARRIYATIKGCGTNTDGFKPEGVAKPSSAMQRKLLESIYEEFKIDPSTISYMEAHGTGTRVGDVEETNAIADFFCQTRNEPLLIGSVKTNIGHTEMSSGVTSIIKAILTMQHGVIPPILHLEKLGEDIVAVRENKLKPVTEITPWTKGLIGVSSFGVGGTNAHVVLEPNIIKTVPPKVTPSYRLVLLSGRNEKGLTHFMNLAKEHRDNPETLKLLDCLFSKHIRLYKHNGYLILNNEQTIEQTAESTKEGRPIWFVYSGIGSQWPKMAKDLVKLPVFRKTLEQCAEVLRPYDINLIELVTEADAEAFKNVTNCFISIVAMSICLTDLLRHLGVEPDGLIGHSVGEVCCAYVDGVISLKEAMLIARARGVALHTAPSIDGTLAVIGLTVEEAAGNLPEDINIACYNCVDNLTISGPRESIVRYVNQLKTEDKFARVIEGADMAYHSKYIKEAGDVLFELLKDVIVEEKVCSKRWVSSSMVLEGAKENEKSEILHNAEYFKNNLVNSVHFYSAMKKVPDDAIVVEISPKGLLQTVIRRNLGTNSKVIALSSQKAEDNFMNLLSSLGELHIAGASIDLRYLYDSLGSFPVCKSTPSIAPLIEWERTMKCQVPYYSPVKSFGESVAIDLMDPTMKYLEGHMVEGKIIYPVMGYACLAWEVFARLNKKSMPEFGVVIENLKITRMTLLPRDQSTVFTVNILNSNGDFEISESDTIVCYGNIQPLEEPEKAFTVLTDDYFSDVKSFTLLNQDDVYYKLNRLGFQYQGAFRGIVEAKGAVGKLKWNQQWVSFLDTVIHYTAAVSAAKGIFLPESIGKLIIDPVTHLEMLKEANDELPIKFDEITNVLQCGKVEIRDFQLIELLERKSYVKPKLEKYEFIPYRYSPTITLTNCILLTIQIVYENLSDFSSLGILVVGKEPEVAEGEEKKESLLLQSLRDATEDCIYRIINDKKETLDESTKINKYNLIIIEEETKIVTLNELKLENQFILFKDSITMTTDILKKNDLTIISKFFTDTGSYILVRKKQSLPEDFTIINVTTTNFDWVNSLKEAMQTDKNHRIYLLSEQGFSCGIIGLFNCLRFEETGTRARVFFLIDGMPEKFSFDSKFYREQLEKDLSVNVYKKSSWGSYRFLPYQKVPVRDSDRAYAKVLAPGDLTQIKMVEESPYLKDTKETVYVYCAGMNFKDVLIAGGILRIPGTNKNNFEIGYEYSGRTSDGRRVFGLIKEHAFGTRVEPDLPVWDMPDNWTFEEAASIPVIYFTLYYAFYYKTKLHPGLSILIHSASGGVGMAAIQMALNEGCKIFATVGSDEKKKILLEEFPQLDEKNIFISRDNSFEFQVRRRTKGRGVDIVLNSLAGDLFNASLGCVAVNGHFVEIGKTEFLLHTKIQSGLFLKSASLHAISIDEILIEDNRGKLDFITPLIQEHIKKGLIKPIPRRTVYSIENISEAFKFFQTTTHTGKIILKIRDDDNEIVHLPSPKTVAAIPRVYFDPEKSYIIVGGFGGLGLELAISLSMKGAKHIVLNSRSPPKYGYQYNFMEMMHCWGTAVHLNHDDASSIDNAEKLLKEAMAIAPIGGIFNLAMVNRDATIENQTAEDFIEVFKPKGLLTKNLDILSRKMGLQLDHFVAYSSITCGRGNLGQTNYGFANSTLERIVEKRNEDGLPGLVIEWGPMADVGYSTKNSQNCGGGHFVAQPVASYVEVLHEYLLNTRGIVTSTIPKNMVLSIQVDDSLLEAVLKLLGITNTSNVSDDTTLLELGMDSLMGFEIKQYLYREHQVDITVKDLRIKTIREIKEIDEKRKEKGK